jgi:3-hydroxybutyryl-CoA dehydrogenase
MGAGIAQVALEAGHEVVIYDVDEDARERGVARVRDGLTRRATKLDLDPDAIDDWVAGRFERLRHSHTIEAIGSEAGLAMVIEAVLEDLALKEEVFRALDASTPADVMLATNTSALSVERIAACAAEPSRVLGLHFFNPVPLMPLVEVVRARITDPAVVAGAVDLMETWGKTAVVCADAPGFIVNRVNRPFTIEALRLLEEGEADVATIDRAIRGAGFPMGPFELMDLIGLDVNLAAATAIWDGLGRPERLRPSTIQRELVEAGRLGRKTGRGFYDYATDPPSSPDLAYPTVADALGPLPAADIVRRIRDAILEEARLAVGDGVAGEASIDLALRLGAAHPEGPFAWAVGRT